MAVKRAGRAAIMGQVTLCIFQQTRWKLPQRKGTAATTKTGNILITWVKLVEGNSQFLLSSQVYCIYSEKECGKLNKNISIINYNNININK